MLTAVQIAKAKNLKLSSNFNLYELIKSESRPGLVSWPEDKIIDELRIFANEALQPIRDKFGRVNINSGYRNAKLNKAVGGVSNSIHQIYVNNKFTGVASDIVTLDEPDLIKVMAYISKNVPGVSRMIIYRRLRELGINSPFIHIDSDIKVSGDKKPVVLEKAARNAYVTFDVSEFDKYDF